MKLGTLIFSIILSYTTLQTLTDWMINTLYYIFLYFITYKSSGELHIYLIA